MEEQFSIDQRLTNPLGALLENRAGIYFDFNVPVMTNTVFHPIGRDFLTSGTWKPSATRPLLQAWPNPANQATTNWAEKPFAPSQLLLRNALGRVVRAIVAQGQTVEIQRAGLPTGLYFMQLRNGRGESEVGSVVW